MKMFLIDALVQEFLHSLISYLTGLSEAWMLRLVHLWNVSAWGKQQLQEGFSWDLDSEEFEELQLQQHLVLEMHCQKT